MILAKVSNGVVLKFPYTREDLYSENQNSSFDDRFSLVEWYSKTDDAKNNSSNLVEVALADIPVFDQRTEKVTQDEYPVFESGSWILKYTIHQKNQEEIDLYDNHAIEFNYSTPRPA